MPFYLVLTLIWPEYMARMAKQAEAVQARCAASITASDKGLKQRVKNEIARAGTFRT